MDGCIYFYPKLARPRSQRKEGRKEEHTPQPAQVQLSPQLQVEVEVHPQPDMMIELLRG
jgi:hypothetical protein